MMVIDGNEYELTQPRLKEWLRREEVRRKIGEASKKGDRVQFLELYLSFISDVFTISVERLKILPWIDVARAYVEINNRQVLSYDFPMLLVEKSKKDDDWNYVGRYWYIWLHKIAKSYGWSIEYIENLVVDDAVALLHEISSDDFYLKEWEWGLSENAYSYDSNTKTGKYNPLPIPKWMQLRDKDKELPKVKIRKDHLPVGIVVSWSRDAEHSESS